MEDAGDTALSQDDVVGPFHPFVEVEGEAEENGCTEGHTGNGDLDVALDVVGEPLAVEEPSCLVVLEEEPVVPLPRHAYSKVGKIPLGTYSREALRGKSVARPLLKCPYLRQVPRGERTVNMDVACPVVQLEVDNYAENAKGISKRIKFKE